jgi:ubiquinone/menaquinone biosynthesis C-methylase UbiE
MKDNFSDNSGDYAKFRPRYPQALIDRLVELVPAKQNAWDCGTGNGQLAAMLAPFFKTIYATDISMEQMREADRSPNIWYSVQPAESTSFENQQFDLITVAQAIHWFQFEDFYYEVKRTLVPNGIIAVIGYGLIQTEPTLQKIIDHLYRDIVGPYWDAERRYIDEGYKTIPFRFREISMPTFEMQYQWSADQLIGYINTWSAVKHYIKQAGKNPLKDIEASIRECFNDKATVSFGFPLLLRVGINEN